MGNAGHMRFAVICTVGDALGTKTEPIDSSSDGWSLSFWWLPIKKKSNSQMEDGIWDGGVIRDKMQMQRNLGGHYSHLGQ
jgi:hypothetical protein